MKDHMDLRITPAQAAQVLGINLNVVRDILAGEGTKAWRTGGDHLRYRLGDIVEVKKILEKRRKQVMDMYGITYLPSLCDADIEEN